MEHNFLTKNLPKKAVRALFESRNLVIVDSSGRYNVSLFAKHTLILSGTTSVRSNIAKIPTRSVIILHNGVVLALDGDSFFKEVYVYSTVREAVDEHTRRVAEFRRREQNSVEKPFSYEITN